MKNDTQHSELLHLTTQKLTGESSTEELSRLDNLIAQSEENRQLYNELIKTWEGTEQASGITQDEVEAEWNRLKVAMQATPVIKSSYNYLKIAASVALFIAAGVVFYFSTSDDSVQIVAKAIQTEELIDGSSVTLNAAAQLSYSSSFGETDREVQLQGEAYFDVERNPEIPFVIHTPTVDVTVLGTSFTVRAVESEPTVEVVVSSGVVEVSYQGKVVRLEVGEKGIMDKKSGQLYKLFNEDENFMAWKTKRFIFDDIPLKEVIDILNNAYQSSLYLNADEITNCPVTVTFEGKSLDSILEVLKVTLDLSVQETSKGIEISGAGC